MSALRLELEGLLGGRPLDDDTVERIRRAAVRVTTDDQMLGELTRRGHLLLEQPGFQVDDDEALAAARQSVRVEPTCDVTGTRCVMRPRCVCFSCLLYHSAREPS
jgi:hypothetical protein